ncbi:MAG: TetR/AcrR family transcriptional regulator [Anaerolineae bacterium]
MKRSYSTSAQTRLRILEQAQELFNEQGTAAVSTNHIAARAGISPGNLYYHFKNKEEIIRSLLHVMVADWNPLYVLPQELTPSTVPAVLRQAFKLGFELIWKYRFFYREQVALLRRDPELLQHHMEITEQRLQQQRELGELLAAHGLLRLPVDRREYENVLTIGWILNTSWLLHLESIGISTPSEADFEHGADLLMQLFEPYFIRATP